MEDNNQSSRRKFIQQTAMAGDGLMLANSLAFGSSYTWWRMDK